MNEEFLEDGEMRQKNNDSIRIQPHQVTDETDFSTDFSSI